MPMRTLDVAVIGGGQAALAAGFYLRRTTLRYVLFDANENAGGAWPHAWPSLHLFSPAKASSLPGWPMPAGASTYPTRDETIAYLAEYERRYELPVERPVRIVATHADGDALHLITDTDEVIAARAVISATGTWTAPQIPHFEGQSDFQGPLVHSAHYHGPETYAGKRVLVVGAGNSGAQILDDLVDHCRVTWVTAAPPVFLPDDVDGQYLFDQGTARFKAIKEGRTPDPPRSLGDIVMIEPVRAIRDRGLLQSVPVFMRFTRDGVQWPDHSSEAIDAVIFATGFNPALKHLAPLATPDERGHLAMDGLHAAAHPQLYPLGYGDWTGFASATLIGVGRAAKAVVDAIAG
jgi:cation diffusion facilitator CzcD-associated flavoprotein CzcO